MTDLEQRHAELVEDLFKPGVQIHHDLSADDCEIIHATLGVAGEAGEIVDAVKKFTVYRKPCDRDNLIEELGDMEFFLQALRKRLFISREETLEANVNKLSKRYSSGSYSDKQAQDRADKQG